MEGCEKIRKAYYVEGQSIRTRSRQMRCSRKLIRQALEGAEPKGYQLEGGVESDVGYAQRSFFAPIPKAKDFAELNAMLYQACMNGMLRIHAEKTAGGGSLAKRETIPAAARRGRLPRSQSSLGCTQKSALIRNLTSADFWDTC